jgi:PGF-pre-PGF domain-containing protein
MRDKPVKIGIVFAAVLMVSGLATSQGTPELPHTVDGDVAFNGDSGYTGTVEARHSGNVLDSTEIQDGSFGSSTDPLLVSGILTGDAVKFYVDGIYAGKEHDVSFGSGKVSDISLSLSASSEESTTVSKTVSQSESESNQVNVRIPEAASKDNSGVDEINISVDQSSGQSISEVNVTVSNEANENEGEVGEIPVEDQENNVHGNIDVDTDNNAAVESATINFKVNEDRVDDTSEIVLYHYENGDLVEKLDTTYLEGKTENKDNDYYYFESETTSFSSFTIVSDNQDPNAEIETDSTNIESGDTVDFDGSESSDGETDIISYEWDFGDGEGSDTGETVSHTYEDEGDYIAELTVTDQGGNTDTTIVEISVEDSSSTITSSNNQEDEEQEQEQQEDQTDESETDNGGSEPEKDNQIDQDSGTDENTTTEETDETGQQNQQTPTGLFTAETGGLAAVIVLLIAGILFYAQRTGRIDIGSFYSSLVDRVVGEETTSSTQEYEFK